MMKSTAWFKLAAAALPALAAAQSCSSTNATKFTYFGVNESGAEFGNTAWPGQLGKDYTWPADSSFDYFLDNGFNTFRITFLMERLAPPSTGLSGAFNTTYLSGLQTAVSYVTNQGGYAVIDPHNFGRYDNSIIYDTTGFQTFWKNLAAEFASNDHVIFDTNNEYHDMDNSLVFSLNQAAINGIRSAGATRQLILVEGNSYTGAWTWVSSGNGDTLIDLVDPNDNFAYEMHQYLDSDGSGTSETCVSSTIGAERLAAATTWLQQNGKKGFLGEMGAGSNSVCQSAVEGALCAMQESGVWIGMLWWAAGQWWGDYYQSIEPTSGPAVAMYVPLLESFQ
jgi:endoglucanase